MKKFIKDKLESFLLNESVKGGQYVVYHGSPNKIDNFSDEFVGGEKATDQEGPGIYFTTSKDDARMYGEFIHEAIFTPRVLWDQTPTNPKKLRPFITKMVLAAPDWKTHAQNYDENPRVGVNTIVESTLAYNDTEKDVAQQIWYDFYKNNPIDYVRNMVKMGVDGLTVKRENGVIHFIIYNPSTLKFK